MLDMVLLFLKEIDNDNEDYARRMRTVLDPDMAFYRDYGNIRVDSRTLVIFTQYHYSKQE